MLAKMYWGAQDGGGTGQEDHFLPNKFIKRSFECWTTSTKQLLNAGGGYQAPRKAVHSLQKGGCSYWLHCSPLFWLSLFSPGHLYLLPPPPLIYLTLRIPLGVPGCGKHLGNWLLARFLSPLLTPLFCSWLPLSSSSLFCSLCNYGSLSVSLGVEDCFTINLDLLASVLYGWRSLEATVREGLKARVRRLNSKT